MKSLYLGNKAFVAGLVLLLSGFVLLSAVSYRNAGQIVYREAGESLVSVSQLQADLIRATFAGAERHVRFLHDTPPVQGIIRALQHAGVDPKDATPYRVWVQRLETIFASYILNNPSIVQIRYIGLAQQGRELVRVQRQGEAIRVIPSDAMQQKGERPYFQKALDLGPNQVYLSEINLNREWGEIERPSWPTYRVIQAVYTAAGDMFGMIVVNLDARPLLSALTESAVDRTGVFLLNDREQFLLHPDASRNFEHEFGRERPWSQTYVESLDPFNQAFTVAKGRQAGEQDYLVHKQMLTFPQARSEWGLQLISVLELDKLQVQLRQNQVGALMIDSVMLVVALALLSLYWLFSRKGLAELAARAQFDAIVRGSNDIILGVDRRGSVLSCNDAALQSLGWTLDSLSQRNLWDLADDSADKTRKDSGQWALKTALDTVLQAGTSETVEIKMRAAPGTRGDRYASVALSPIALSEQVVTGVAVIMRDITIAREWQARLQLANQVLLDKNAEMERFIYTVSHDLKSPLVTIKGFAESVLRDAGDSLDQKARHRLQRILANVENMGALLNDLLALSRLVTLPLQRERCDVHDCIEQAKSTLSEKLVQSACELDFKLAAPWLCANRKMLIQCVQNLLENAVNYRAVDSVPRVEIRSWEADGFGMLSVKDNGPGIEPRYQDKIFRIFERLDTQVEGTGVGLAIVKTIMEKHGGNVTLQSQAGQGAEFILRFPTQPCSAEACTSEEPLDAGH
ncbi:ATP-binding protein [Ketobacter sp.]|uniref:sensor histidine kinase n=1 Tax=Ketobacter sp. TaxID=2083498 RepID=UPI000F215E41|nr:ATP-binding protein [Ketobacter sp.]RLU01024.1 MAG: PAS domain S-box protein [Ketobacter sp.]